MLDFLYRPQTLTTRTTRATGTASIGFLLASVSGGSVSLPSLGRVIADSLQSTIRELELKLMTPLIRNDASLGGALMADDFVEFGSCGSVYNKREVLAAIANKVVPPSRGR